MKNKLIIIILTIFTISNIKAQNTITTSDITAQNAGEGDLYILPSTNVIYIGLSDGSYHPINKNLEEILDQANDAGTKKITNLGAPTSPSDAATKEYVDNRTGGESWNLIGNTEISSSSFIGTTDAHDLILKSNDIEKLRLVSNKAQVLINKATSFNSHPLVIRANGVDVLAFEDASGSPKWHWNLLANGLNFVESGILDYRLFLKNGGNVGINTNNPTAKLHIAGDMQLDKAFKDKDGQTGTNGQVLSSTGTGTNWVDNTSANTIYNTNGTLTTNRTLSGAGNSLTFTGLNSLSNTATNIINSATNLQLFGSNAIQLQSTGGTVQIAGPGGIQLQNNTTVTGNISVSGSYIDSNTTSGSTNDVLSSTGTGTDWHPLVSTNANNAITVGSDKGVYRKTSTIQLYSDESVRTESWSKNRIYQTVSTKKITIKEESIVELNYIFTFKRVRNGRITYGEYRGVHVNFTGPISKSSQMSTLANTYSNSEIWASCTASKKYKLSPGTYTFTMYTYGSHQCETYVYNNAMYGWSFDITVMPTNF